MKSEEWLKLAYPVSAEEVAKTGDDIAIAEHALNKWKMLRPKVLKEYGLYVDRLNNVVDMSQNGVLEIDGDSCSLCCKYIDPFAKNICSSCPLKIYLGCACDKYKDSPWKIFNREKDVEPMIKALEGTLKMLKEEKKCLKD